MLIENVKKKRSSTNQKEKKIINNLPINITKITTKIANCVTIYYWFRVMKAYREVGSQHFVS